MPFPSMRTFDTITLREYQELYGINKLEMDDLDKMTECVSIISGKTVNELEEMSQLEFKALSKSVVDILSGELPDTKPKKELAGVGICYEPGKLTRGQYVTLMHFLNGDTIENCHLIMASISYNLKSNKHEADKHKEIAEKLQDARFIDVYAACVFFCQLFVTSIKALENYFLPLMMKEGMTKKKAQETLMTLTQGLDGCMLPSGSQSLRA